MMCLAAAAVAQTGCGLLIENTSSVTVCNNIVVFNSDSNTNVVSTQNITQDAAGIFFDDQHNFTLINHSPAINAGVDACCTWQTDLNGHTRVVSGTVDMGAYEYPVEATAPRYAVHQTDVGQLTLCNNIIVNNPEHTAMTNLTAVPGNNILSDSMGVFQDAVINFNLWAHSPAVDAGLNSCNTLSSDMADNVRIHAAAIDIGAYEYIPNIDIGLVTVGRGGVLLDQHDTAHEVAAGKYGLHPNALPLPRGAASTAGSEYLVHLGGQIPPFPSERGRSEHAVAIDDQGPALRLFGQHLGIAQGYLAQFP